MPVADPPLVLKAMRDVADDDQFWTELGIEVSLAIAEVARRTVLGGTEAAAQNAGVIVDFEGVHQPALDLVRTWLPSWWASIEATTREGLRTAIDTWLEQGLGRRGLPDLIDAIEPLFGPARAERIAATEATRLFAEANVLAFQTDPTVLGAMWSTAEDEFVCKICGPRHEHIWPLDSLPEMPAHVRCRCVWLPADEPFIREVIATNPARWHGPPLPPPPPDFALVG